MHFTGSAKLKSAFWAVCLLLPLFGWTGVTATSEPLTGAKPSAPETVQDGVTRDGHAELDTTANFELGVGDKLYVELYNKLNQLEFKTEVSVDNAGYISLPSIFRIKAQGLTVNLLRSKLAERYSEILRNPVVNVYVEEFNSKVIQVLGAVRSPGPIKLRQNGIKLLAVIAEAKGLNDAASNKVRIIRANEEADFIVDLSEISEHGKVEHNVLLGPGDTVIALKNDKVVYVNGQVKQPKEYPWSQGLTVLQAITMAGGFTEDAAKGRTTVFREKDGKMTKHKVKPHSTKRQFILEPNDVVKVPGRIL